MYQLVFFVKTRITIIRVLDAWELLTAILMLDKQTIQIMQNWKKRIDNSSRAYLYKHIKHFKNQPY